MTEATSDISDQVLDETSFNRSNITEGSTYTMVGLVGVGLEVLLMFLICFGNGLIFAAFVRNETLRTLTNYYILQLAIADFGVGILMPMHIAMFLYPAILQNADVCMFRYTSMLWLMSTSIFSLVAMTYDRFLAVTQPLRYQEKLTKKQYILSVFAVWSLPTILGLIMPSAWHNYLEDLPPGIKPECDFMYMMRVEAVGFVQIPMFIISTTIIISLYIKIFHVASKHAAAIAERDTITQQNKSEKKRLKKDMKMVKTGLIILGSFYVCWTPFILMCAVQAYGGLIYDQSIKNIRSLALFPAIFNSALNPIVYPFRMAAFKIEFMRILRIKDRTRVREFHSSMCETET